jgi:hypothetical protein
LSNSILTKIPLPEFYERGLHLRLRLASAIIRA